MSEARLSTKQRLLLRDIAEATAGEEEDFCPALLDRIEEAVKRRRAVMQEDYERDREDELGSLLDFLNQIREEGK